MFERDEQEISRIIAEGLEAIQSGEKTLEEVLAENPEQAAAIRPELEAAGWLISQQAEVSTRPGFVAASRKRVVERIQQEASGQNAKHSFFGMIWPQRLAYRWVAVASLFLVVLSGLCGVVTLSQNSLPGEDLYQVKRAYEQVAISVAPSEAKRATLAAQFSRRRLEEARQLIGKGDYAAAESSLVEFEQGVHQAITHLQQVSDRQLNEKQDTAVVVQQNLSNNADQLAQLAPSVPPEILGVVIHARDTSISGVVVAAKVIDEVNEKKSATATATLQPTNPMDAIPPVVIPTLIAPTSTRRPTSVPTVFQPPAATATQVPADPATPVPPPANTPEVTLAPTQVASTVEATPTVAPSETPTDIPTVTDTAIPETPTPAPSETPQPTSTPLPDTATPVPTEGNVTGTPISGAGFTSPTPTPTDAGGTPSPANLTIQATEVIP